MNTMKGILEEMMTLFPDQYFHLGLDEVITTSVCTMESKSVEQSHQVLTGPRINEINFIC